MPALLSVNRHPESFHQEQSQYLFGNWNDPLVTPPRSSSDLLSVCRQWASTALQTSKCDQMKAHISLLHPKHATLSGNEYDNNTTLFRHHKNHNSHSNRFDNQTSNQMNYQLLTLHKHYKNVHEIDNYSSNRNSHNNVVHRRHYHMPLSNSLESHHRLYNHLSKPFTQCDLENHSLCTTRCALYKNPDDANSHHTQNRNQLKIAIQKFSPTQRSSNSSNNICNSIIDRDESHLYQLQQSQHKDNSNSDSSSTSLPHNALAEETSTFITSLIPTNTSWQTIQKINLNQKPSCTGKKGKKNNGNLGSNYQSHEKDCKDETIPTPLIGKRKRTRRGRRGGKNRRRYQNRVNGSDGKTTSDETLVSNQEWQQLDHLIVQKAPSHQNRNSNTTCLSEEELFTQLVQLIAALDTAKEYDEDKSKTQWSLSQCSINTPVHQLAVDSSTFETEDHHSSLLPYNTSDPLTYAHKSHFSPLFNPFCPIARIPQYPETEHDLQFSDDPHSPNQRDMESLMVEVEQARSELANAIRAGIRSKAEYVNPNLNSHLSDSYSLQPSSSPFSKPLSNPPISFARITSVTTPVNSSSQHVQRLASLAISEPFSVLKQMQTRNLLHAVAAAVDCNSPRSC